MAEFLRKYRTSPLYNTNEYSGILYSESCVLVHYQTLSPEMRGRELINNYFQALHATDDPIEAANQMFGDRRRMSDKLDSYISSGPFHMSACRCSRTFPYGNTEKELQLAIAADPE